MQNIEKRVINASELGQMYGLSRPTVYRLARRTDFPVLRVGRCIKFPRESVIEWFKAHEGEQLLGEDAI